MNWDILQDPIIIARLVLQVVLFVLSALFSMSETALFSLRDIDLQRLDDRKHPQAERLRNLIDEPRKLIVSILCGNELINIAATINLAGILFLLFDNSQAAAIANTAVMLPLLLIFGEITPKTLAVTRPVPLSLGVIEPVLTLWVRLVMPLRAVVRAIADRVTTLIVGPGRTQENILGADEFRTLLEDVEAQGVVNAAERRVILNLIEAGHVEVGHIMVPRPRICFIDAALTPEQMLARFRSFRHRRIPVYEGQRDSVIGQISEDTVLSLLAEHSPDEITREMLLTPATFVPMTQTVSALAEFFKTGDHHAALVVNEFGGIEGMVTADDVFGFLTGGERVHLDTHAEIEAIEGGAIRCAGLTPLRSLRERIALPAVEGDVDVTTVGGLIMALMDKVPAPGDEVTDGGLVYRVVTMQNLLIDEVLIAPQDHAALTPPATAEDPPR